MQETHEVIEASVPRPLLGCPVVEIGEVDTRDLAAIDFGEKSGRTADARAKLQQMAIRGQSQFLSKEAQSPLGDDPVEIIPLDDVHAFEKVLIIGLVYDLSVFS